MKDVTNPQGELVRIAKVMVAVVPPFPLTTVTDRCLTPTGTVSPGQEAWAAG